MIRLPLLVPLLAAVGLLVATAHDADAGARRSRPLKTGQITCWDSDGIVISCARTGQDGDLRRGENRAYLDKGDGTIRDLRTALMWEKLSDDLTIHDVDNAYEWDSAFDKIAALNTPPCFASFCDWRLPNRFELETLINLGAVNPAVSAPFNANCAAGCSVLTCSCTFASHYWSSSSIQSDTKSAWSVEFFYGSNYSDSKTVLRLVRAVRGGS
jgi:hypothetical protein